MRKYFLLGALPFSLLVIGCASKTAPISHAALAQTTPIQAPVLELVPQNGHSAPVGAATFTPDGKLLLTGGHDATLKFWLTGTGEVLRSVQATTQTKNPILALTVASDGKTLASAAANGELRLWNVNNGKVLRTLRHSPAKYEFWQPHYASLTFSQDGKTLFECNAKTLHWWDVATGKIKLSRPLADNTERAVLSPNGKLLALADTSNAGISLWDVSKGTLLRTFGKDKNYGFLSFEPKVTLAFSADGNTLYYSRSSVWAWNTQDGTLKKVFSNPPKRKNDPDSKPPSIGTHWDLRKPKRKTALSPDGTRAARLINGELRIWNIQTGIEVSGAEVSPENTNAPNQTNSALDFEVQDFLFSPDSESVIGFNWVKRLDSAEGTGKLWLWDATNGLQKWANVGKDNQIFDVAFARDKKTLACSTVDSVSYNYGIWLWNMQNGVLRRVIQHPRSLSRLAFSPDGKIVAAGETTGMRNVAVAGMESNSSGPRRARALWWDVDSGNQQHAIAVNSESVQGIVFTADGKSLVSGGGTLYRGEMALLDAPSGKIKKLWMSHPEGGVISLARSFDGKLFASGSWDNSVRLWDAQGNLKRKFDLVGGFVFDVKFSPDGRTICVGTGGADDDGYCTLFNLSNGKTVWERNVKADIYNIAFSPDGATLLVNTTKGTALWNAKNGKLIRPLSVGGKAQFSPDGRLIISTGTSLKICDVRDGKLLISLELMPSQQGAAPAWLAYTPDGFYDGSPGAERQLRWRVGTTLENASQHTDRHRPGLLAQVWAEKSVESSAAH